MSRAKVVSGEIKEVLADRELKEEPKKIQVMANLVNEIRDRFQDIENFKGTAFKRVYYHKKEVDGEYIQERKNVVKEYKKLPPLHIQRMLVKTSKKGDKVKKNTINTK